jgi:ribosome-binding protein aMBF1 (putative translation factor)
MKNWKKYKKELLNNNKVKAEYDKLAPRYELISQLIKARNKTGLTQKELAEKIGTKQSAIARLESGKANPSVVFLEKLASALNSQLVIRFKN